MTFARSAATPHFEDPAIPSFGRHVAELLTAGDPRPWAHLTAIVLCPANPGESLATRQASESSVMFPNSQFSWRAPSPTLANAGGANRTSTTPKVNTLLIGTPVQKGRSFKTRQLHFGEGGQKRCAISIPYSLIVSVCPAILF